MKAQTHSIFFGSLALCLSSSWSFADKGGQPHHAAPAAAPPAHAAPHISAPPPVHHAPAVQAPIHIPAPPAHIHQAPMQMPKPQARPQIRQAPAKSQAPLTSPKFKAPSPQGPVSVPQLQGPMKSPTFKTPPPSLRGTPLNTPHQFGSPQKQLTAPIGGALTPKPTAPSAKGVFPKIRTQQGTPFKPWATLPTPSIGAQTPTTTAAPLRTRQDLSRFSGTRGLGRGGGLRQTFGARNFRNNSFFRHHHHRNFSSAFFLIPALLAPYYYSYDYPNYYYPYYTQDYYPFYENPYFYEEPYYFYEPNYIEIYIYTNEILYPQGYNINRPTPYPMEAYPQTSGKQAEPLSLEMQELGALLQSVLQTMKIFDSSVFYTLPEFSDLKASFPTNGND